MKNLASLYRTATGAHMDLSRDPRQSKVEIMGAYGLAGAPIDTLVQKFEFKEQIINELGQMARAETQNGRYMALLVRGGEYDSVGGCPVHYFMDKDEAQILTSGDGNVINGPFGRTELRPGNSVTAFSRPRSATIASSLKSGDVDYMSVRYGGGFRLQLDRMDTSSSNISIWTSFNDYGSRVLSGEEGWHSSVPQASINLLVSNNGSLKVNDIEGVDILGLAAYKLAERIFSTDGRSIMDYFDQAYSLRPVDQVHQVEGIYGHNGCEMKYDLIDIDGIDAFDHAKIELSAQERLRLAQMPFNIGDALISYEDMRSDLFRKSLGLDNNSPLRIGSSESLDEYFKRVDIYRRLGYVCTMMGGIPSQEYELIIFAGQTYSVPSMSDVKLSFDEHCKRMFTNKNIPSILRNLSRAGD